MKSSQLLWFVLCAVQVFGFWRMQCSIIQLGRLDAVVNPGTVSGHVHTISGAINFNISSTYDTLQQSFCTSCQIQQDKSAYWTPQLYYQSANGSFTRVKNDGTVVYYLGRGENVNNTVPFPPGFRMVSGDPYLRSYDTTKRTYASGRDKGRPIADRVSFNCLQKNYVNLPETPNMNRTDCGNGLRAQVHFPSCWDGVNLYKSDQSHVAYLSQIDNGLCPPTHPQRIPHLFYEVYYQVDKVDTSDGGKFVFAQGDTTGYGFHGDFLNGWDIDVLRNGINQCLVGNVEGVIAQCPPLAASNDESYSQNCPQQPSYYNEEVIGPLSELPGCNPVTSGPDRAPVVACSKQPTVNNQTRSLDGLVRAYPVPDKSTLPIAFGVSTYKGCYQEVKNGRALNSAKLIDPQGMTLQMCANFCTKGGYSLFGVEYSQECYCGNSINTPLATQSGCNMACKGNIAQWCGGGARLDVWTLNVPAANSSYMGCYRDVSTSRLINGQYMASDTMSYDACAKIAAAGNYPYFGLEFGRECFVGNPTSNLNSSVIDASSCNMACTGANGAICGGRDALTVFKNTAYVQASSLATATVSGKTFSYAGCYAEGKGGRALADSATYSDTMTIETCLQYCGQAGYQYAGLEYSRECYCSKAGAVNGGGPAPDGETGCNMLCAGSKKQTCGGPDRLSVYKLQKSMRMKRD